MGVRSIKVYEYWIECDECGIEEVLHTGDSEGNVFVHSIDTARRVAHYHKCGEKLLCKICHEKYVFEKTHKRKR